MINKAAVNIKTNKIDLYKLISILLILISLGLIIHRAWLCDDSFITFRTLDNFVHGYHLTWNTYERVQAYTHPLWLFFLIPIYALTHEIYLTVISVCVVLSALALFFLYRTVEDKKQLVIPLTALALSNAYINFSTSGLENALLNFLFSLLLFFYLKKSNNGHFHFWIYFISSLIAFTRLDTLLIVLPVLVYVFFSDKRRFFQKLPGVLLGFLPLILWEIFSLWYYGFLLPNTFYAKLNAGMPLGDYLQRGWAYLGDTVTRDPVTALGLIIGFATLFFISKRLKPITLGVILYFFYVIYIGGDFMSGRMFATLFFVAMGLIAQNQKQIKDWFIISISIFLIIIGFLAACPTPFLYSSKPDSYSVYNIMDERQFYQTGTGLFRNNQFHSTLETDGNIWNFGGYPWIVQARESGETKVMSPLIRISTGLLGYYGGPDLKIIDKVGLSDPLIARLPAVKNPQWRIGHLYREIPEGYVESITNPDAKIQNSNIDEYNRHLKILTQGSLFSKDRLLEIIRFNLGDYNYLLK
jgi:arabinofuranosyltransferase